MKKALRRIALAFINRVRPPIDPLIEARRLARWLAAGSQPARRIPCRPS